MTTCAARFDAFLLAVLASADDGCPIAEVCRRVGRAAEVSGRTRPSYERVRQLVHQKRRHDRLLRRHRVARDRLAALLADAARRTRAFGLGLEDLAGAIAPAPPAPRRHPLRR